MVGIRAKDALGAYGERVAVAHLVAAGLTVLDRNWRCPLGEIDIVARDGDVLVVCEVKTRSSTWRRSPAGGGDRRQGRPAAPAGGGAGSRTASVHPAGGAHRPRRCASDRRAVRPWSSTCEGWPEWLSRGPVGVALVGVDGHLVEVEADLGIGVPSYTLVGLPDASLSESRDRVRAAMVNSGQALAGDQARHGEPVAGEPAQAGLELRPRIAGALLGGPAGGARSSVRTTPCMLGELGLDGRVRPVRGVLPGRRGRGSRRGRRGGRARRPTPPRPRWCPGVRVTGVRTLAGLVARARGEELPEVETAAEVGPADARARRARRAGARPGRRPRPGDRPVPRSRWPPPAGTTC